jgi:rsbT co-antagonist protein RsbR
MIRRRAQELFELSTPVVQLWDKIFALPLIGTLDGERAQTVMENLLNTVVSTRLKLPSSPSPPSQPLTRW